MVKKTIVCKECGKEFTAKKKCNLNPKKCCDCVNDIYGCYDDPFFRIHVHCRLFHIDRIKTEADYKHIELAFGCSLKNLQKDWKEFAMKKFDEIHTPFKHTETKEEFAQRMKAEAKLEIEPPDRDK